MQGRRGRSAPPLEALAVGVAQGLGARAVGAQVVPAILPARAARAVLRARTYLSSRVRSRNDTGLEGEAEPGATRRCRQGGGRRARGRD